jgi:general L-amino acid transport system permease protein
MLAVFFVLMYGDSFGLTRVETDRWGGFPLTLLLASLAAIAVSFASARRGGAGSGVAGARWTQ